MKTFSGLIADCFKIFREKSSEYDWKRVALSILLPFILLRDTHRVCASSLYCLALISSIKCRRRPRSGGWRLCNAISVGSGLPVYTLQSSFPSSPSRCDTTDFLVFLVLSAWYHAFDQVSLDAFVPHHMTKIAQFSLALPGIVHVSLLLAKGRFRSTNASSSLHASYVLATTFQMRSVVFARLRYCPCLNSVQQGGPHIAL